VRRALGVGLGAALVGTGAALWARARWAAATRRLVARLYDGRLDVVPPCQAALADAPPPVSRYLRAVIGTGVPPSASATLRQRGEFLVSPGSGRWRPFTAVEHFTAQPPGFVWDAAIGLAPGLSILVRDGFVAGEGSVAASLLGLVHLAGAAGTPALAVAALQRYLAEAVWLPAALLPRDGLVWSALDPASARATLTAGSVTASVDFHFGDDGLVDRIFVPDRPRDVGGGRTVPTPWQGHFRRYAWSGGYRLPLAGEVEWLLPGGPLPYWRGEITRVDHGGVSGSTGT
jgi:hypothetical protein